MSHTGICGVYLILFFLLLFSFFWGGRRCGGEGAGEGAYIQNFKVIASNSSADHKKISGRLLSTGCLISTVINY